MRLYVARMIRNNASFAKKAESAWQLSCFAALFFVWGGGGNGKTVAAEPGTLGLARARQVLEAGRKRRREALMRLLWRLARPDAMAGFWDTVLPVAPGQSRIESAF